MMQSNLRGSESPVHPAGLPLPPVVNVTRYEVNTHVLNVTAVQVTYMLAVDGYAVVPVNPSLAVGAVALASVAMVSVCTAVGLKAEGHLRSMVTEYDVDAVRDATAHDLVPSTFMLLHVCMAELAFTS